MGTVISIECYLKTWAERDDDRTTPAGDDGYCQCESCKELRKYNLPMWERIKHIITKEEDNAPKET